MSQAEEWKEGYKVCEIIDGELWSAIYEKLGNKYPLGESAKPHPGNGPLMVFTDLFFARRFAAFFTGNGGVFKCRYRPTIHDHVWSIIDGKYSRSRVYLGVFGDPFQDSSCRSLATEVVLLEEALPI